MNPQLPRMHCTRDRRISLHWHGITALTFSNERKKRSAIRCWLTLASRLKSRSQQLSFGRISSSVRGNPIILNWIKSNNVLWYILLSIVRIDPLCRFYHFNGTNGTIFVMWVYVCLLISNDVWWRLDLFSN